MQSIINNKPLIHTKFYCKPNYHINYSNRFANFNCSSLNFAKKSTYYHQSRVSNFSNFRTVIRASTESPPSPPPAATAPEKNSKKKLKWEPLINGQLISYLQLGFMMLTMQLCRPFIPLPWTEPPRTVTSYVSVPYSEFVSKINSDLVVKVEIDNESVKFKLRSDGDGESDGGSEWRRRVLVKSVVYCTTRPVDIKAPYEKMVENCVEFGCPPDKRSPFSGFWSSGIMILFCIALLFGVVELVQPVVQQVQEILSQMETTGQLRPRKSGNSDGEEESELGKIVTFADVAGVDEAKAELEEIVEFLRNPDRYIRLGARAPRGVLLVGLPGTGKTLLARAVSGEANVSFISCSASEFVELFAGMGASRVRDLFARAKKEAPSIIFIDEIDAVAKHRGGQYHASGNDERDQTLNQLLTEMDGFDTNSAVIVIGATNRADVLDPAIRRPGRFDRVVEVETPDRIGRLAILKVHASKRKLPLAVDVDLNDIATMTTGFTGADLANVVNEAALLAGRQNKVTVEKNDFTQAVERSIAGIEKMTAKLKGIEKAVVARHEAGHAVVGTAVANLLSGLPQVEKLSILPRSGGALGFTYIPPTNEDKHLLFVDELRGRLVTLLGGRAAEEFAYAGRVSTGAVDDITRATDMAYKAIAEYGLSQTIGPVSVATLSSGGINDSGAAAWGKDQGRLVDLVQREVTSLLQSALDMALCVIRANAAVLEGLGAHLEENEKVEGEELHKWLKLVAAPPELSLFVQGKQESFLPPQPIPEPQV